MRGNWCRWGCLAAFWSCKSTSSASPLISPLGSTQGMGSWEARRPREGGPADLSAQPDGGQDPPPRVPKAPGTQCTSAPGMTVLTSTSPGLCLSLCSLRWERPSPENETPERPNLTFTKHQPRSSWSVSKISVSTPYKVEFSCPSFRMGGAAFHWIFNPKMNALFWSWKQMSWH